LATSAQHHSVLDVNAATHRNTLQHHPTNCNRACAWVTSAHHKAPCRSLLGSLRCNTLQHTATHCNTLQHAATPRNTLQQGRRTGDFRPSERAVSLTSGLPMLQHTATHCNTLQHTATHCNTLQHTATNYNRACVWATSAHHNAPCHSPQGSILQKRTCLSRAETCR